MKKPIAPKGFKLIPKRKGILLHCGDVLFIPRWEMQRNDKWVKISVASWGTTAYGFGNENCFYARRIKPENARPQAGKDETP